VDRHALADTDLVIVLGGDGTLISMARDAGPPGTPLLGLDVGSFGFLATEEPEFAVEHLEQIVSGDFSIDERLMLQVSINHSGRSETIVDCALNDIIATGTDWHRAVKLKTSIGGRCVCSHRVDGMIISTPTGSTAYNLSAGGPIVDPGLDSMTVTAMNPHTLCFRPMVVPADSDICIELSPTRKPPPHISVHVDGQVAHEVPEGGQVMIQAAPHRAKLAHLRSRSFYDNLKAKLNMG
jgi:NAD+ kinase